MKHTPTPWFVKNNTEIHDRDTFFDESGARIGSTPNCIGKTCCFDSEANAEHIVKCVNAHDGLVDALSIIADAHLMANITVYGLQKIAKQALKAAGEEG